MSWWTANDIYNHAYSLSLSEEVRDFVFLEFIIFDNQLELSCLKYKQIVWYGLIELFIFRYYLSWSFIPLLLDVVVTVVTAVVVIVVILVMIASTAISSSLFRALSLRSMSGRTVSWTREMISEGPRVEPEPGGVGFRVEDEASGVTWLTGVWLVEEEVGVAGGVGEVITEKKVIYRFNLY